MEMQRLQYGARAWDGNRPQSLSKVPSISSKNRIISSLAEDVLVRLNPKLQLVSFRTGQEIIKAGELIDYLYFPETMVVSQLCYLKDGSSAAVAIIGNDGLLGLNALLNGGRAKYSAIASIGGAARRIRVQSLRAEYAAGSMLERVVLAYLGERLFQSGQQSVCGTRHHLEERLCTWLLMVLDRSVSATLPVTHEAIADHLGVRRAGVTESCNTLRDRGIVATKRARLTILNRAALESFACECYERLSVRAGGPVAMLGETY
jgi:CRP-like cAMP-binding protein